mgnify:FL=1|tara:strand:+ start:1270 stop:1986 length:717 start_codon:yes stop_codon:yes gene_type:complete
MAFRFDKDKMKYLTNPDDYKSNWEWTKSNSNYHFDKNTIDGVSETFRVCGTFHGDWEEELKQVIKDSKPVTWATRGKKGERKDKFIEQEEYDLTSAGASADLEVSNFNRKCEKYTKINEIAEYFKLENFQKRIHVQTTGQVWNLHIDKLYQFNPEDPSKVVRITIMLNDWEPGQFYMYGNRMYERWKAGEIHIFDWPNVPHSTANTSYVPRVSLQLTGVKTEDTDRILNERDHYYSVE